MSDEALAAVNSIDVYANGLNVAFCLLFTIAIWNGLLRKTTWVFWALAASTLVALLGGVGADYVVGVRSPEINLISGLLLAIGFSCCAPGILRPAAKKAQRLTDRARDARGPTARRRHHPQARASTRYQS